MKPLPIILIVVVLAAAGVGGYFMMQSDDDNGTTNTNTTANANRTSTTDDEDNGLFSGSIEDLIARGDDLECTYTFTADSATSTGTTYFSDGKMRGDFVLETDTETTIASSMIQDETYLYTWTDGATTGTKFKIDEFEDTTTSTNTNVSTESVDTDVLDTDYEYDCDDWNVDESKFTPPSDVTFQDLSALTEQMQDLTNTSALQCASCGYLTGDAQTECLQQYDCE